MSVLSLRALRFVALLILVLATPPATGWAWCGSDRHIIDGYTRSMWSRTWNAQNSLTTPLTPYFMPRAPGVCRSMGYACGSGCQNEELGGRPNQFGAYPYSPAAAAGFDPVQFERLGRVPNELSLGNALATSPGAPAATRPAN